MPTQPQLQQRAGVRPPVRPPVAPKVSRLARMQADGVEPSLPPASAAQYLVGYLFEVGPLSSSGMGAAAVSWVELQAWQQQVGVELSAWEARTLRRLSAEFAAESRRAEEWGVPSPVAVATTEQQRASVAKRIGLEFGAMAAAMRGSAHR